jgi:hypothetical protein
LWNSLQRDFPRLPRLSFSRALAGVVLWGLLFIIVLTMISGARELMTPGAWQRQGFIPEFINRDLGNAAVEDAGGFGLSHYAANSRVLGSNRGMRRADITDGTSTTLLVGEVNANFQPWGHPVNWRDPAKGINKTAYSFGGPRSAGGARFLMADGSVRFISAQVSPDILRALATPAGGEEIDPGVLQDR